MTQTEKRRYVVYLYNASGERTVETFTWAYFLTQAKARVADMLDRDELFEGYSFKVFDSRSVS
jgi:hypothetical protein